VKKCTNYDVQGVTHKRGRSNKTWKEVVESLSHPTNE